VTDSRQLIKRGGNLLQARSAEALTAVPAQTTVLQGHLEKSDVDPTTEIINLMTGMRAFEANAKMISYADTSMSQLNTVGRVA
jgi:flagellar basal body rod protein FlgG